MTYVNPDSSILTKLISSPAFTNFISTYNVVLTLILGAVTILILILLFINITKLSSAADNDFRRRQAINGILVCLVCLAIMGGLDTVYAVVLSFVFNW